MTWTKEKQAEAAKRYAEANPEKRKESHRRSSYKTKYGITLEDYNNMFEEQEGCCAICNIHQLQLREMLAVDHCHKTGKVRGLLCRCCNRAIGLLYDDKEIIFRAMEYLDEADSS